MMSFYVECENQKRIINILVGSGDITHLSGRAATFNRIKNLKNIIALVDKDPKAPPHPYLNKARLTRKESGIELFVDENKNRVIVISPTLEEWIYELANKNGVNVENYGFSKNVQSFIHEAKVSPTNFQQLIHMLRKNKNKELEMLEELLKENKL